MADVKISALPAVTVPGAADLVPVVQSGVTSQMTMANLMGYSNSGQPPAPKPNGILIAKDSLGVGQSYVEDIAASAGTVWPNCGGSVVFFVYTYGGTLGAINNYIGPGNGGALASNAVDLRVIFTRIA